MAPPRRQLTAQVLLPVTGESLATLTESQLWTLHELGTGMASAEVVRSKVQTEQTEGPYLDTSLPPALQTNLLQIKNRLGREALRSCHLCERHCGIDRLAGEVAYCGIAAQSYVGSEFIHMGEEEELVPSYAVFFAGCTFHCVYCQAHRVAFNPQAGLAPTVPEWVALIGERQRQGARNVNFVGGTPEPHIATILEVAAALPDEVNIPLIMNANMSMTPMAMQLLDGVIDLYLADFRHGNDDCARRLMAIDGYTAFITRNLLHAAAHAELLIRVLVLPNHLDCCLRPILEWIAVHMPQVRLHVMFQYRPSFKSWEVPDLARQLDADEKAIAMRWCRELELNNLVIPGDTTRLRSTEINV